MEFDLLRAFAEHPNRVLSRDQLLTLTRNREWEPFDRSIDIRIARLRRKIEDDPDNPKTIKTIRGVGLHLHPVGLRSGFVTRLFQSLPAGNRRAGRRTGA